jgi:meso-butanediol dehydrogenase/(S,S)-butanediol dehydrogenase/diacetyl reductase
MSRLAGKVALITGGGAGIGAATARLFCTEGASVVVVERDPTRVSTNSKILTVSADVADESSAVRAIERALQAFGRLDVLVNNAAMRNYSAVAQATPEEWLSVVSVNLMGAASFAKAALPALRKSGKGAIVNVSSTYAIAARKGMAIYDATKAGLLSLTRTLAHEEAQHGVRVNAVCPGSTLTDFHIDRARKAGKDLDKLKRERDDTSLLGRWATPEEIAAPILWLASDEASFITGATLMVDGGLSIK